MSDFRTTTGNSPPESRKERRQRRRRIVITAGILVLLAVISGALVRVDRYAACSGYVTTENHAEVRSATVGKVAEILVFTGNRVRKGDVLVHLDDSEERAMLNEEQDRKHKIEAELSRLQLEIAEEKRLLAEGVAIAKLGLVDARARCRRTQQLLDNGLVAASAIQDARLKENLAQAELNSLLNKDHTIYEKRIDVLEGEIQTQQAVVNRAEVRARLKVITTPVEGQVLRYGFTVGELVTPNVVLYEIFGDNDKILKLHIGERHAMRVMPGNRYRARLGPYRGLRRVWFEGTVIGLRDVIQGEKDQRYRMAKCTFDAGGRNVPVGTTADARVHYGKSCLLSYLLGLD